MKTISRRKLFEASAALLTFTVVACSGADEVTGELPDDDDGNKQGKEPTSGGGGDDDFGTGGFAGTGGDESGQGGAGAEGGQGGAGGGQGGAGGGQGGAGGQPPMGCGDDAVGTPDHPWHPPITIPLSDIQAGIDKTYDVPSQNHTHQVTITAADFAQLMMTGSITLQTTKNSGHKHDIDITCTLLP